MLFSVSSDGSGVRTVNVACSVWIARVIMCFGAFGLWVDGAEERSGSLDSAVSVYETSLADSPKNFSRIARTLLRADAALALEETDALAAALAAPLHVTHPNVDLLTEWFDIYDWAARNLPRDDAILSVEQTVLVQTLAAALFLHGDILLSHPAWTTAGTPQRRTIIDERLKRAVALWTLMDSQVARLANQQKPQGMAHSNYKKLYD
jgi:hypothetical protein